jgi:hypothetical protein
MDRETKDLITPGGHKVTVKSYLTAREVNGVLKVLFADQSVSAEQGANQKLSLLVGIERNIKLVEAAVVSLDDSTENLAERLQDLPASEYTAILNEVKELASGNF